MIDISTDFKFDSIQRRCGKYMLSFGDTENEGVLKILIDRMSMYSLINEFFEIDKGERTMDIELKPCPFCGGAAKLHSCAEIDNKTLAAAFGNEYGVHCIVCGVATLPKGSALDAVRAWNRRADNDT